LFVSEEREFRARIAGIRDLIGHLLFYPNSIAADHLGRVWLLMVAAIVAAVIGWAVLVNNQTLNALLTNLRRHASAFVFMALAILIPIVILNVTIHKSPVPGSIVIIPFLCAVMLIVMAFTVRPAGGAVDSSLAIEKNFKPALVTNAGASVPQIAVAVFVGIAIMVFMFRAAGPKSFMDVRDREAVNRLNDRIIEFAMRNDIVVPVLSIDRVVDYLFNYLLTVRAYERFHRSLLFCGELGQGRTGTIGVDRGTAIKMLAGSDVIVLTDARAGRQAPYPMNEKIGAYWADLWNWATANRLALEPESINGIPHSIFVKPLVKIRNLSAGWITRAGIIIEADASSVMRWPFIILEGQALYDALGGEPAARARAVDAAAGQAAVELPTTFKRVDTRYQIVIDARAVASMGGTVHIALTFDRHFVPSRLGTSADARELVVLAPSTRELVAREPEAGLLHPTPQNFDVARFRDAWVRLTDSSTAPFQCGP
jgi:hypothetical protein